MPNRIGVEPVLHSKAVRKLASSLEIAMAARYARKTAMAAMITRRAIPEPRERPRKILSPARPVERLATKGCDPADEDVGSISVFMGSPVCGAGWGCGSWCGGAPDGAACSA